MASKADTIFKHIEYKKRAISIDFDKKQVKTEDACTYCADKIITTIPWTKYKEILSIPIDISKNLQELKHVSTRVDHFGEYMNTDAHWIYCPDLNLAYHRIFVRQNFCPDSKGYWTETNGSRMELGQIGEFSYINKYAYPLNTLHKPQIIEKLLSYGRKKNIYGLGRWGEHSHYNSDVTVECAMKMSEILCDRATI